MIPSDYTDLVNVQLGDYYKGIDISHHNRSINWETLRNRIDFCYIKLSDGRQYIDDYASIHANGAKSINIPFGFYHFARPDEPENVIANANQQASRVLELLDTLKQNNIEPQLPFGLDLENVKNRTGEIIWDTSLNQESYLQWIHTFSEKVFDPIINPQDIVIYGNKAYLDNVLPDEHDLGRFKLWVARYNQDCNVIEPVKGWQAWDIWQFTEQGLILPDENEPIEEYDFYKKDLNIWKIASFPI